MFNLTGKTALVTGASRGIGFAIAETLKKMGATVIGTATTEEGAKKIHGKVLNVADPDSIAALLAEIPNGPDILVNNAGITRDNLLLRMKEEEWNAVIETNLTGVFRLTKACLKPMLKARWGRIITIGSVSGIMGNPGQTNYSAAKAGLIGFSKALAPEIASRNITVNVIAPGFIDTDMTRALTDEQRARILAQVPAARLGSPDEIAATVGFLASPEAAYITGETIQVNGGMYMQ
ncbi:MAG TPA: 3-oxoacyl-ACP reductase FabG [Gammaproteobacteria bacterium]|nr:3-oxoacyl-ACP reductase FabG [Gammaproteobacteria bacterium]